jgi:hypothetical protein
MGNKWARKATEREREISVTLYHFFETFADLTSGIYITEGFRQMVDEANKIQTKYPECQRTIIGIMEDINRMAKEHSQNG